MEWIVIAHSHRCFTLCSNNIRSQKPELSICSTIKHIIQSAHTAENCTHPPLPHRHKRSRDTPELCICNPCKSTAVVYSSTIWMYAGITSSLSCLHCKTVEFYCFVSWTNSVCKIASFNGFSHFSDSQSLVRPTCCTNVSRILWFEYGPTLWSSVLHCWWLFLGFSCVLYKLFFYRKNLGGVARTLNLHSFPSSANVIISIARLCSQLN